MMNEETGEFCLFISDDVEVFGVFGAHRKFLRIDDDFIFDGDGNSGVEEFDRNEIFFMFFSIFGWLGGLNGVFRISVGRHDRR